MARQGEKGKIVFGRSEERIEQIKKKLAEKATKKAHEIEADSDMNFVESLKIAWRDAMFNEIVELTVKVETLERNALKHMKIG